MYRRCSENCALSPIIVVCITTYIYQKMPRKCENFLSVESVKLIKSGNFQGLEQCCLVIANYCNNN